MDSSNQDTTLVVKDGSIVSLENNLTRLSERITKYPMKLGLASDLHLDFGEINPEFFTWRGDALFLAGDIAEDDFMRKHCHAFFDGVSKMANRTFLIAGNHEFYGSELDVAEDHIDEFLEQWPNIIMLRNSTYELEHLSIFGGTMWTDFHGSPVAAVHASLNMNDYKYIRMRRLGYKKIIPPNIIGAHNLAKNKLLDFLEADTGGLKLVMTHHAPLMQSVPDRYKHEYELNKAYCNRFDSLIENFEIAAWVHGHTHDFFDYEAYGTRIMCNPRGYPGERPAHLPPYQPLTFIL